MIRFLKCTCHILYIILVILPNAVELTYTPPDAKNSVKEYSITFEEYDNLLNKEKDCFASYEPKKDNSGVLVVTKTSAELDIKQTKNTIDHVFSKFLGSGVFNARRRYLFQKVKVGNDVVWESEGSDLKAIRIRRDGLGTFNKIENIVITLCNGNFKHFKKSGKKWVETNNVLELNLNNSKTSFYYRYVKYDKVGIFNALSDFCFKKLYIHSPCKKNVLVYETNDPKLYVQIVLFSEDGNKKKQVIMYLMNNTSKMLKESDNNKWIEVELPTNESLNQIPAKFRVTNPPPTTVDVPVTETKSDSVTVNDVENNENEVEKESNVAKPKIEVKPVVNPCVNFVELDINSNSNTKHSNYYNFVRDFKTFSAKGDYCFNVVKQSGDVIYQTQDDEGVIRSVLDETGPVKYLSVLLNSRKLLLFQKKSGSNSWENVTATRHTCSEVKLYSKNQSEYKEIEDPQWNLYYFTYSHTFSPDFVCDQIRYNDKVIWDFKDSNNGHPHSLVFNVPNNTFYLVFKNKSMVGLNIDKFNATRCDNQDGLFDYVVNTGVTVNVDKLSSTSDYEYSEQSGLGTFTPEKNCCFNTVKHDNGVVWSTTNPCECVVRVTRDGIGPIGTIKVLSLTLLNGNVKQFSRENGDWVERNNLTELNVCNRSNTAQYNYTKEDNIDIFTAKRNCCFNSVKRGKSLIWTGSGNDCSDKVLVDGKSEDDINVTINLQNNIIKHFHRHGKNNPWSSGPLPISNPSHTMYNNYTELQV